MPPLLNKCFVLRAAAEWLSGQVVQDAGSIPVLLPYLGRRHSAVVQLEALHALYNLCKISRTRQEAAAVAGIVPYLVALAQPQVTQRPPPPCASLLSSSTGSLHGYDTVRPGGLLGVCLTRFVDAQTPPLLWSPSEASASRCGRLPEESTKADERGLMVVG